MTEVAGALRARPATYAGLFVVTLTTLMYEIVLTRIFSVTMWYHFAFVAISVALFGMTVGALIVHLRPAMFPDEAVKRQMHRFSLFFSVSIVVAFLTQLAVPFVPRLTAVGLWSVLLTCVVISVPFVCSGVVVCLALTRFPSRVNRLYATDLVGAGLGCVLLVVAFNWLDGPSLVVGVAALASVAALAFAVDAGVRGGKIVSVAVLATFAVVSVGNNIRHDDGKPFIRVLWTKEVQDPLHVQDRWNAFSRVTVDGDMNRAGPPAGWGLSTTLDPSITVPQLTLTIDSTAATSMTGYDGGADETDFLRYDVTNIGFHAQDRGCDVATIGVGGGRDVLSALEFGCDDVTGIEINGNILGLLNDTYGDFSGHLDEDPRVHFVNDEARSWLTRTDRRFDQIQISMIDTWAATAAGAFSLSENSLYTTDAWATFFDRLSPGGVLSVSRWYEAPGREPLEMLRTTALAAQALTERGVENPRDHILIYAGPQNLDGVSVATLLVSPEPFPEATIDALTRTADRMEFPVVLTPDSVGDSRFAELAVAGGPEEAIGRFKPDISAPTDDRPFFFQMARLSTFLGGEGFSDEQVYRSVATLALLALAVLLLAGVCIGGPLVHMARAEGRRRDRAMRPFYLFFAGIGLGFMFVEFSQLQRLSTFLGHPTYALGVVLFTVLLFGGVGSMLVERVTDPRRPRSLLLPLAALLGLLVVFGVATPQVIDTMDGETTPVRILTAVAILAPLALLMGMPFSIGMRAAGRVTGAPTAFLWGINGAMSVVGSVMAALVSIFFGITATFATGFLTYVLAAVSLWTIVGTLRAGTGADEPDEPLVAPVDPSEVLADVAPAGG